MIFAALEVHKLLLPAQPLHEVTVAWVRVTLRRQHAQHERQHLARLLQQLGAARAACCQITCKGSSRRRQSVAGCSSKKPALATAFLRHALLVDMFSSPAKHAFF